MSGRQHNLFAKCFTWGEVNQVDMFNLRQTQASQLEAKMHHPISTCLLT